MPQLAMAGSVAEAQQKSSVCFAPVILFTSKQWYQWRCIDPVNSRGMGLQSILALLGRRRYGQVQIHGLLLLLWRSIISHTEVCLNV